MGHGVHKVYTCTFASAAVSGSAVDMARSFAKLKLDIPARSNTTIYILGSADGVTFRRIYAEGNSATAPALFQIASAATSVIVPIPGGYQYLKIETQDAEANGVSGFKIIASDE